MQQDIYPLSVNRDQTLDQMIANGRYDLVSHNITEAHFLIAGSGTSQQQATLVHFNRYISTTKAVVDELDCMGLRPGDLQEICALGEQYPELQRDLAIVELKSVWLCPVNGSYVVLLTADAVPTTPGKPWRVERCLKLLDMTDWRSHYRFLAFCKTEP